MAEQMKNLIHNLNAINMRIDDTLSEIRVIEKPHFFKLFTKPENKEVEISVLRKSLHEYYAIKHSVLENLESEIRKEKMKLSGLMRDNTLKKTG